MTTAEKIRQRLNDMFSPSSLEVIDDSAKHRGHTGNVTGGGHFLIKIHGHTFCGKNLVERHRMIYAALNDLMGNEIHALGIEAFCDE